VQAGGEPGFLPRQPADDGSLDAGVRPDPAAAPAGAPVGAARTLTPVPDERWGLHLADGNIALGNLVDDVGAEAKAYLKKTAKRK
jgi:hypothetical protein